MWQRSCWGKGEDPAGPPLDEGAAGSHYCSEGAAGGQ